VRRRRGRRPLRHVADARTVSFKWVKGELIGKGSYGKVFIALNVTTGDVLAVKQVELPKTTSDREDDRQNGSITALKFEIETLKDLDHPHIVQYLGFEQTLEHLSIFLEYVPGGSVGRWVRKFGKFEEPVVQSFASQILDGLAYLHAGGILHRDLKADNCLVDLVGVIKISDFGISKRSSNVYEANEGMSMQGSIFWSASRLPRGVGFR
jgi:mitogen-activated protein kinase kinase kinase